jgi:hypothetical protein
MKLKSFITIFALDLAGTFLFAVEGAVTAADAGLDVFGILVLSFSTALIGVARDLLIGAVPPQAIKDWRYPAIAFAAGAATFLFHHYVVATPRPVFIALDAAALSLFAIAGAEKALDFGINPFVAALMGTLTAVGGRHAPRHLAGAHSDHPARGRLRHRRVRRRGGDDRGAKAGIAAGGIGHPRWSDLLYSAYHCCAATLGLAPFAWKLTPHQQQ